MEQDSEKCEKLFRCRKREIPLAHMTGGHISHRSHCSSSCSQAVSNAAASLTVLSRRGMNTQQNNLQEGSQGFKNVLQVSKLFVHTQSILLRALVQPCRCWSVATPLLRISNSSGSYSSHHRQTLQMPVKHGEDTFAVGKVLHCFFFSLDIHHI